MRTPSFSSIATASCSASIESSPSEPSKRGASSSIVAGSPYSRLSSTTTRRLISARSSTGSVAGTLTAALMQQTSEMAEHAGRQTHLEHGRVFPRRRGRPPGRGGGRRRHLTGDGVVDRRTDREAEVVPRRDDEQRLGVERELRGRPRPAADVARAHVVVLDAGTGPERQLVAHG